MQGISEVGNGFVADELFTKGENRGPTFKEGPRCNQSIQPIFHDEFGDDII